MRRINLSKKSQLTRSISQVVNRRNHQALPDERQPHVVIVGGGFGGLNVAKALRDSDVRITLVDQHNYHLFQPLLYQVATGALSPADIASPIRAILRRQRNARVVLARAESVDVNHHRVELDNGRTLQYDILVVAAGAQPSYFGHPDWKRLAPGLKDIDDAVEIRNRIFEAFERAERSADQHERRRALTFVIVGGGPTGVELAGSIGEIAHDTLVHDFRVINPEDARILIIDGGSRILAEFPPRLSHWAERHLHELGVELRNGSRVTRITPHSVWIGEEEIPTDTVLWAAGVTAAPLGQTLGVELEGGGRVIVNPDLTIPRHPDIFVIGDLAATSDETGNPLPGTAPVAIQAGEQTAANIKRRLAGEETKPFAYRDRGMLATIGRGRAVGIVEGRAFDGLIAWGIWALIHIWSLIEFRTRLMVMIQWAWAYVTRQRSARLIIGEFRPKSVPTRSEPGDDARQAEPVGAEHSSGRDGSNA